jgi:ABC-type phosphate transport system substrate-binding protein
MKTSFLFAGVVATLAGIAHGQDVLSIHGSGTTNPSKCYWQLISQFTEQVKVLIHMSYRAVGSSTGQFEFIGENNTVDFEYTSWNDWGSGDIPVKTKDFEKLVLAGKDMVHLPIFLGAISFFHSIPGVESGTDGLNVTGCVLARIFNRKIKTWDHPEILEDNKQLKGKLPRADFPITVTHRVLGSSSTASITEVRSMCIT